ncbi:hypothetical protein GNF67_16555 [Clostridium perfringens]|nr:hypothetical protein [Clostridium perfringens]
MYYYIISKTRNQIYIKVVYLVISKETIIPMHWHNSLEIAYVISGQINYIVEGINYNLGEDEILWNSFPNTS